jgi:hypothetical protein
MTVNREQLLALLNQPLREKVVPIDGLEFKLREMNEAQGAEYELCLQTKDGDYDYARSRRELLARMLIDADGNQLVSNADELKPMARHIAGRLYEVASELNRYDSKEIDSLAKKSDAAPASA